jgi:hypothetical protein
MPKQSAFHIHNARRGPRSNLFSLLRVLTVTLGSDYGYTAFFCAGTSDGTDGCAACGINSTPMIRVRVITPFPTNRDALCNKMRKVINFSLPSIQ